MKLTKETYKDSLEARWRRGNIIRFVAFAVIEILLTVGLGIYYGSKIPSLIPALVLLGVLAVVMVALAITNAVAYCSDIKNAGNFKICEATLSHTHFGIGFYKGTCSFTADFEISEGEKRSVETNAIWVTSILSSRYFGEYCNKKASIAYSPIYGRVIVIDQVD